MMYEILIDEIDKLLDDFKNCDCGESYMVIDGHEYHTDVGYAFDGIYAFAEILKERLQTQKRATHN